MCRPRLPASAAPRTAAALDACYGGERRPAHRDPHRRAARGHRYARRQPRRADLLAYPLDPSDRSKPVRLLSDTGEGFFVAQSGLVSNGSPAPDHKAVFTTDKTAYALADGAETLEVPLTWTDASGVSVRKVYIFRRASYLIDTRQEVTNAASSPWTGNEYRQLQRVPPVIKSSGFAFSDPERFAFAGAAWYSPKDKFQKLAFDKFAASPLKQDIAGGWAAMLQHYFFAAWIPDPAQTDTFTTETVKADSQTRYLVRDFSPALTVRPNETKAFSARLYVGPKLQSTLDQIAPGLALTVDYGVLTFIASPMHWVWSNCTRWSRTGAWRSSCSCC
jgi:YidC/Oxa1 family membrane protein insertase